MDGQKFNFTPEQQAAVEYRGGALLVSAAAGSGKTKVLVDRLLSRVGEGDNVNEFLIITYTRAAASELREKIYDEILKRLADEPENRSLRRQSMLCRGAPIGTIHSFCTDVLRENSHIAGLPPDFRVADESESDMIKAEVLEEVLNEAYENSEFGIRNSELSDESGFMALIDTLGSGRDDKRLVRIILETHAKLQSNPNPRAWAQTQIDDLPLPGVSDVSKTVWGTHLIEKTRGTAAFWLEEMARLRAEIRDLPDFERAYGASVEATLQGIETFLAALNTGWDEARRCCEIDFPGAKPVKGYEDLKDIRLRCKSAMKKCAEIFECGSDEHIEDMRAVAPAMAALLRLVLDFDIAYSREKYRRGIVDFSDLEHLALSILKDEETGEKTGLARAISRRFKEIMVDEYQDVNAVQELIFNAVSRDGKNIFMVGDVKQSIYRFRLADPSIFLEKYGNFSESGYASNQTGKIIHLSKNFRSRPGILDAVNSVFSKIMSKDFGEMDYTDREMLLPGDINSEFRIPNSEFTSNTVELDIIDMSGIATDEDEESPEKTQVEAQFIAKRIAELTSGSYMIPDKEEGSRKVGYSDIVILLRSVKDKARLFATALSEHDIPVDLPGGEGFFETIEISAALSLLSVIDNPMQDIPLASALRGPVYGFTADELAGIRAASRGTDYYGALVNAAELDSTPAALKEKCSGFLDEINAFRAVMPDMPADRFIWHVYNKTGLLERVCAMRGGDRRRSNLILLAESARALEQSGYKGLFGFLTYISGLQERGAEPVRDVAALDSDAVRIMSIHKSKGLEFPIVILADTSKQFNFMDIQRSLVLHPELGVGTTRTDRSRRIEYTTLARMAIQSKLKSEVLAEELRVLYVAMTRAREKLIITMSLKDAGKEIEKLSRLSSGQIPPQILEDVRSMGSWIILSAVSGGDLRFTIHNPQSRDEDSANPESTGDDTVRAPIPTTCNVTAVETKEQDCSSSFIYPYAMAPDLPSKLTVTGLKGRHTDRSTETETLDYIIPNSEFQIPNSPVVPNSTFAFSRPSFVTKKTGLTASERGTALHLALQYLDYQKCGSDDGVVGELRRLVEKGLLAEEQAAVVDVQKLMRFFKSEIGKRVLESENVSREFKFSLLFPAEQFYPGGGDDKILLQGVVDCFFEEDGALTLVDFKTDYVTPDTFEEKAEHYAPQLNAYATALERITGKCVRERYIYFFSMDLCHLL